MPQLHLYVPDEVASQVKAKASALGLSVSRYLADLVRRDVDVGWPDEFFEDVVGGWVGEPLTRPSQGTHEERDAL